MHNPSLGWAVFLCAKKKPNRVMLFDVACSKLFFRVNDDEILMEMRREKRLRSV